MKILVISNVYPPYYRGGYELFCKDVAEGLKKKGHTVCVLISTFGPKHKPPEENIIRKLVFFNKTAWEENIAFFLWAQFKNTHILKDAIKEIKPDLIFCWNLRGMS